MILLADSGSTKTDWSLIKDGKLVQKISTKGTNPFFQSKEDIRMEIKEALMPQMPSAEVDELYFYGAGCAFPDKIAVVKEAIGEFIQVKGAFEVNSDMLAAARGLCGHKPGIACILGTGSNSCFYDGAEIVENVSPLGFILGDEGSGAVLGKILIGDILKNQLSAELQKEFFIKFPMTRSEIINRVYCKPFPNRFLASLSIFYEEHIEDPQIQALLVNNFKSFLKRNVMEYEDYKKYPINFIGSIAYFFKAQLEVATKEMGLELGKVEKSPMEGLIKYHTELD
jgi:N-acetylglucosamine kinase-like BadF-type ATPase